MKHFKINVGRKKLSSDYIQSKQSFETVLKGAKISKQSFWTSPLFYGAIGLGGIAIVVGYEFITAENSIHDTIITKENKRTSNFEKEYNNVEDVVLFAQNTEAQNNSSIVNLNAQKSELDRVQDKTIHPDKKQITPPVVDLIIKDDMKFAETPIVPVVEKVRPKVKISLPSISGVYNGDITWEKFKTGNVFVNEECKVEKYSIQYTTRLGDKMISVENEQIPNEVISELEKLGLNQTVFITNIIAKDNRGELIRIVSMDLNLKF